MRARHSLSVPISVGVTLLVWYGFLWTMQHAPTTGLPQGGNPGKARSRGGLANQFATEVVRFFDDQDPRRADEAASSSSSDFWGQVPELLPLPEESREAIRADLPEIYENLSLTARNLFRSDVDLDGDGDLDMALLVRLSKDTAVGAVLSYTAKKRFEWNGSFRFAGKFTCNYEAPSGFERCFQIIRTGSGAMHIASYGALDADDDVSADSRKRVWRLFRLEEEQLVGKVQIEDSCPTVRGSKLKPVPEVSEDLMTHTEECKPARCQVWHYSRDTGKWQESASRICPSEE
jgi:hypothetical protein